MAVAIEADHVSRPRAATARHHLRRHAPWIGEIALVTAIFMLYQGLRGHTQASVSQAFANSATIERIQRWMSLDIELEFNRFFVETPWLATLSSLWYQIMHVAVTVAVLVWLWVRHRSRYARLRTTLAVVTMSGFAIYAIFPLAPPRFALAGAVDTMHVQPILFAGQPHVDGWANLYAAMPSIHVAWAVWCALAVSVAASKYWRAIAWLYPLTTTVVVIGTANHYVLDVIAGAALVIVAHVAVRWAAHRLSHVTPRQRATMGA